MLTFSELATWRRGLAAAVATIVVGVVCVFVSRQGSRISPRQSLIPSDLLRRVVDADPFQMKTALPGGNDSSFCGLIEQDQEYRGADLYEAHDATTASECCAKCQEDPRCRIWTLSDKGVCMLKALLPDMHSMHAITQASTNRVGYLSGLPFQMLKPGSLFCFALMRPESYEQGLLVMQRERHVSIFACDEYAVYSSKEILLHRGVKTSVVNSDLKCKIGGEFQTALNNDIFLAVWDKVFKDARYKFHDWVVKADPDSVFFPQRLRVAVQFHPDTGEGIYLNNCRFGLHGPLEVLSKNAVDKWAAGTQQCVDHFNQVCSGPCLWGEDMFMDQCMQKVLKVKRDDDWNLLSEPHCEATDWQDCKNGRVTFHPFKKMEDYEACLEAANYGALPKPVFRRLLLGQPFRLK